MINKKDFEQTGGLGFIASDLKKGTYVLSSRHRYSQIMGSRGFDVCRVTQVTEVKQTLPGDVVPFPRIKVDIWECVHASNKNPSIDGKWTSHYGWRGELQLNDIAMVFQTKEEAMSTLSALRKIVYEAEVERSRITEQEGQKIDAVLFGINDVEI